MANLFAAQYGRQLLHTAEFGDALVQDYDFQPTANPAATDKIYFGNIAAGTRVMNVAMVNAAGGAGATLSLGFEPLDASGPAANPTAFFNAQSVAAAGRTESAAFPVQFEQDVALVGTVGGAFGAAARVNVVVTSKFRGAK